MFQRKTYAWRVRDKRQWTTLEAAVGKRSFPLASEKIPAGSVKARWRRRNFPFEQVDNAPLAKSRLSKR